jgi:hypothetical protein
MGCASWSAPARPWWPRPSQAGLTLRTGLPRGVEAVRRGEYLFLISHLDQPAEVELGSACLDRLTSAVVGPQAVLAPRDVLVLACDPPER